jgi:hypothetical protein
LEQALKEKMEAEAKVEMQAKQIAELNNLF